MLHDLFVVAVHFINHSIVLLKKFVDLSVELPSVLFVCSVLVFYGGVVCLVIIKENCHEVEKL